MNIYRDKDDFITALENAVDSLPALHEVIRKESLEAFDDLISEAHCLILAINELVEAYEKLEQG